MTKKDFILPFIKSCTAFALFISLSALASTWAQAKDLNNRLGIGYSDQFSEDLPGLALRYWPEGRMGFGLALGIDTQDNKSRFGFMARLYRIIFTENNLNFYMGTGAGLVSVERLKKNTTDDYKNESGFEFNGFFGTEFFFTGLENLGFSFEAGIGVTSLDSDVRFRTFADSPLRAGITFYF